jgi:exopolyphosphatase/guanosine-5'-triphosphate,3'-diphosphate pyrophosphatase
MTPRPNPVQTRPSKGLPPAVRPVAVIDIGATAIRMAVAEIDADRNVRLLDTLSQPVSLGLDTFTRGSIGKQTTQQCVKVLQNYRKALEEYGITSHDMRVVATSAVREAVNRLELIDRIEIATGFRVEPIDDAEVNRLAYLAIQPALQSEPDLATGRTLVAEVGGGSTEVLLLDRGRVSLSRTYRLGSLRLQKTMETHRVPMRKVRPIMANQVQRIVEQMRRDAAGNGELEILALGGEMRFAAARLAPEEAGSGSARIPTAALERLVREILSLSVEDIVHEYHVSFPEAETLGACLLAYVELARAYDLDALHAGSATLRDGLLHELAVGTAWVSAYRDQILASALEVGRRYHFNEERARNVSEIAGRLFEELEAEHRLDPRFGLILSVAALLHDIGHYVNSRAHHKHSMYLILNSDLFGLGRHDLLLAALVARYHRRAVPKPTHEIYSNLGREDRLAVAKLVAMLRVADSLVRSRERPAATIRFARDDAQLAIIVPGRDDLSLEQLALKQKSAYFETVFGMRVVLKNS